MKKCNYSILDNYRSRVLGKTRSYKEVEIERARKDFFDYLNTSITAQELYVTDVDEVCISGKTKKILVAVTDVTDNDPTMLDEKNLYTTTDANVDVGCYVRLDNEDWLITFKEHQTVDVKKHFIMRKCNSYMTVKYEDELYKVPISIENLTMYSDGVADSIYLSFMDSKKQIWYGSNPVTRSITENFRILLTHETAFRVTHINDFEYTGLIKSLVLQTAMLDGDDVENLYANNETYYKRSFFEDKREKKDNIQANKIQGEKNILIGEQKEYTITLSDKHKNIKWNLTNEKGFKTISMSESNIVLKGFMNLNYVGQKTKLQVIDRDTDEVIDEINILLRS